MKDHVFELRRKIWSDHRSYEHNLGIKAWTNLGLNGIGAHDLCDTCAVLYQLSYHSLECLIFLVMTYLILFDTTVMFDDKSLIIIYFTQV